MKVPQWHKMPRCVVQSLSLEVFQPWPGEAMSSLVWPQNWPSCEQGVWPETPDVSPNLSHPVTPFLSSSQITWHLCLFFMNFDVSSGIKSSMVRKSGGVVLSLSVRSSEHNDKERDAGGDSFKPPMKTSLSSQATSWWAIPLQSRGKETGKLSSYFV